MIISIFIYLRELRSQLDYFFAVLYLFHQQSKEGVSPRVSPGAGLSRTRIHFESQPLVYAARQGAELVSAVISDLL
ncbi:hypothetical protein [Myxosarcina sp. GI1(2024)]